MTVEIRRRTALPATVAILAAMFAAGYLWLFVARGGWMALAFTVLLAALACAYGVAWSTARLPLLVADSTGVRVRLGRQWAGVPWPDLDRVEVRPRRSLADGRVSLFPTDEPAVLASAGRWGRWETTWNRWVYGAAHVVPYGLTTTTSTEDLPAALQELAGGRTEVVVAEQTAGEVADEAGFTVEESPTGADDPQAPASRDGEQPTEARDSEPKLPVQRAAGRHIAVVGYWEEDEETRPALDVTAKPVVPMPLRRMPGGDDAPVARREEVTITMRRESVEGSLALSDADDARTEELPEIGQLRRSGGSAATGASALGSGNIALIIDTTTDLSARAMRKVRRPGAEPPSCDDEAAEEEAADNPGRELYIGPDLRRARETLGLSVDDLAERTRIRPFVIECMEADDFSPCGGDFYARGHLRMLARVLGIAADPLIATYDEHFATSPVSLREVFDAELATGSMGMVRGGAADANWAALVAAVAVLLVIWGVARYLVG